MHTTVKAWHPLLRIVCRSLAIVFLINFINENGGSLHSWLGYAALFLIGVRFVRDCVGPQRALQRPGLGFTRDPAAAAMMAALLVGVTLVGIMVWLQTAERFFGEERLEELHEVLAYVVLVMVDPHVAAAITGSFHYGENLIAAMTHGSKRTLDKDRIEHNATS